MGFFSSVLNVLTKPFEWVGDIFMDLLGIEQPEPPKDQGYQITQNRSTDWAVPIVYGTARLGGNTVFKLVSDGEGTTFSFGGFSFEFNKKNKYLTTITALCQSQTGLELNQVYFDGETEEDAEYVYNYSTDTYNANTRFTDRFSTFDSYGLTTSASYIELAKASSDLIDDTMQFRGFVSVLNVFTYNRDIYRGEPRPYWIATSGIGDNPIDVLADYLTNPQYGLGLPLSAIGSSFTQAAIDCDTAGYKYNGTLSCADTFEANAEKILKIANADLDKANGVYEVVVRGAGDAVYTFTDDDFTSNVKFTSGSTDQRFNKVVINYTDKLENYKTNSAEYNSDDYLLESGVDLRLERDGGTTLEKRETLDGCDNFEQAMDYAEFYFKRLMFNKAIEFETDWSSINVKIGDIVGVTKEQLGFADKEFRVAEKEIQLDGSIKWKLLEHDDSMYIVNHGNVRPSSGTITYPNPFKKLPAPTDVAVSLIENDKFGNGRVSFTGINDSRTNRYEVLLTDSKGHTFTYSSGASPIYVDVQDEVYSVEVYAVSDLEIKGDFSTAIEWNVKSTYVTTLGFGIQSVESGTDQLVKNADGTINSRIKVTVLQINDAIFRGYVIDYRLNGDTTWTSINSTDSVTYINSVKDGAAYDIRASVLVDGGLLVEADSVIHTVIGKTAPPDDVNFAEIAIKDRNVVLTWHLVDDLDVNEYEVRAGGSTWDNSTSLGRVASNTFITPALDNYDIWHIKAIDTTGNYSVNARTIDFQIDPPEQPVAAFQVIDNNVLLSWTCEQGTLLIDRYEIDRDGVVIGDISGQFTVVFESESGNYDYSITAIDVAGNRGQTEIVTAFVNQPPDYVLFGQGEDLVFDGTKTNAIAESGKLILPVDTTETWGDYSSNGYTTLSAENTAGFTRWLEPNPTSATYVKVFDFLTTIPSCLVTPIYTKAINEGVTLAQTISVSTDGASYTDYVDVSSVYASNIRYVKITLDVTGVGGDDTLMLKDFKVKLDAKIKKDGGNATANAGDASGTQVNFNATFVDITSIILTPSLSSGAAYGIYDFTDIPNPTGFKAYLYNTSGNRVSGQFSWNVTGY